MAAFMQPHDLADLPLDSPFASQAQADAAWLAPAASWPGNAREVMASDEDEDDLDTDDFLDDDDDDFDDDDDDYLDDDDDLDDDDLDDDEEEFDDDDD